MVALTLALVESSSSRSSSSDAGAGGRRERMFEKVVAPSDVGKLNRLVVPKHFAEKHLPLPGAAARAGGTVLCFHDARGGGNGSAACWRFRYSYWSSSQSYVMTKGWSRYVRDKRLAAGDTVAFCRDGARLFIDCRRRRKVGWSTTGGAAAAVLPPPPPSSVLVTPSSSHHNHHHQQAFFPHQAAAAAPRVVDDAVVVMEQEARRVRCLRLFGVNLLDELRAEPPPPLLDLQL